MKKLTEAIRLFSSSNFIEVVKLPLGEQQAITPSLIYLHRLGYVINDNALESPYPFESTLTDEGRRLRTELLGITIPW